jgi:hypothetical protein
VIKYVVTTWTLVEMEIEIELGLEERLSVQFGR